MCVTKLRAQLYVARLKKKTVVKTEETLNLAVTRSKIQFSLQTLLTLSSLHIKFLPQIKFIY